MKTLLNVLIILGVVYFLYSFAGVDNNDEQVLRQYKLDSFSEVELDGPYDIELQQGSEARLEIRASEKIHDLMDVRVTNGRLLISLPDKVIAKKKSIKVYFTVENIEKLNITGAVKLEGVNTLEVDNLKIEFTGAGEVSLDVNAQKIISEINGVGSFWLTGKTDYHKVDFSGVGNYSSKGLISKYSFVESDGIGNVEVYASEKFIGHATGIGSVKYFGQPKDVMVDASGIGKVHRE